MTHRTAGSSSRDDLTADDFLEAIGHTGRRGATIFGNLTAGCFISPRNRHYVILKLS